MLIKAKIGTHSSGEVKVVRKRKAPVVGERIMVIYEGYNSNRPIAMTVEEVRDMGGWNLFFLSMI